LPLQESLHAYQRGAALVGRCREALDKVNQEVKVLEGNLLKPMAVGDASDEDLS
jgi:exodeoxyribonuclease VII small subunit